MDNSIVADRNCKLGGIGFKVNQSSILLIIAIIMISMVERLS